MRNIIVMSIIVLSLFVVGGCAPEIGSEKWCKAMKEKPKGDWTANEFAAYAEHCVFK